MTLRPRSMVAAHVILAVAAFLFVQALFYLAGPAFGQAAGPPPVPSAVLTIEATLDGQAAPPTRFAMVGEAEVARCRALADAADPLHAEAVAIWTEAYQVVRAAGAGEMGPVHCTGFTLSPIADTAPAVPFGPPLAPGG